MAYDFRLPDLGEGIAEGELIKWLVKEGDKVEEHQPIVELETDKAVVQVPSPRAGIILKTYGGPGEKIKVGEILCTIGEAGEKVSAPALKAAAKKVSTTVIGQLEEAPEEEEKKVAPMPPKKTAEPAVATLPAVRKLAQEMGVDISKIQGSGPGGRITEDDVRRASGKVAKEEPKGPTVTFERFGRVIRLPLKGIRRTIAENMRESLSRAAHVTHMDYADVTKLAEFREKEKEEAEKKGVHLTFMPFIVKACVLALKEFPYVNSSLDDEKQEIVLKQYYHIGIAVDTPAGLMVPVVHNANEKTILEIARDIWRVAELARTREIQLKDLQGSTFTITNVGSLGGEFATPVINYPECAILALGRISEKPVAVEGKVEIRKMLPLSLSFDHRIIDGALAAKFVNEIKRHLENPDALLMGY
ncbi:MAG: dihydrolipoamide acetyltransferase family protein [Candidatus Woesearchaeota archaeon]